MAAQAADPVWAGSGARGAPPGLVALPARRWFPLCFDLALILAFAAITLAVAVHHEPWRDEADVWLVTRDRSLPEILRLGGYMGTPMLWYLVIFPFARLGFPYLTLNLVNWALAVAATAILVTCAPLPRAFKLLLAFSYLISFEYAVIARSYILSVLLLFGIASLHARRRDHPLEYGGLLALLCNTNLHGLLLGGVLWALEARDAWRAPGRRLGGVAIGLSGMLAAALQLLPPADGQMTAALPTWAPQPGVILRSISGAFFPRYSAPVLAWLAVAALLAVFASLWRRWRAFAFLAGATAGLLAVFVFVYPGGIRHWGFILVSAVFACWTARTDEPTPESFAPGGHGLAVLWQRLRPHAGVLAIGLTLPLSVVMAFRCWVIDYRGNFSGAKAIASYIVSHDLARLPIVGHRADQACAVLPYLPVKQLWYPSTESYGSHLWWNAQTLAGRSISEDELFARIERQFGASGDLLLLSDRPLTLAGAHGFELVHQVTDTFVADERYYLYRRAVH